MTTAPKVVVIGAGVLGLSTALELVNRGVTDVHVIERSHPGEGSSGRSVGMVETQYFRADDVEARVYGRRFYDRMAADHGLGFVACGYLGWGRRPTTSPPSKAAWRPSGSSASTTPKSLPSRRSRTGGHSS